MFLGFADDVLDLRWSIKISLSFLATLPLLVAYSGPTLIIVPKPLQAMIGVSVNLGMLLKSHFLIKYRTIVSFVHGIPCRLLH
jgi:hypothetical protein